MRALKDLSSVNQTLNQNRRRIGSVPNRNICNTIRIINVSNNRITSIERLGTVERYQLISNYHKLALLTLIVLTGKC